MNLIEPLKKALDTELSKSPAPVEGDLIESREFCLDDIRADWQALPIVTIAQILRSLKGKRIEEIVWVTRQDHVCFNNTGRFVIRVS